MEIQNEIEKDFSKDFNVLTTEFCKNLVGVQTMTVNEVHQCIHIAASPRVLEESGNAYIESFWVYMTSNGNFLEAKMRFLARGGSNNPLVLCMLQDSLQER